MPSAQKLEYQIFEHSDLEVIFIENQHCEAIIARQGAQILHYRVKDVDDVQAKELLWLSQHLPQQGQKAIRGGIPLCFPWFGAHTKQADFPAHGFARTELWTLHSIENDHEQHHVVFSLNSNANTQKLWPHTFELRMHIHCGQQLSLTLEVFNTNTHAFDFCFAWHSYFAIDCLSELRILGLANTRYIDQLCTQQPQQLHRQTELALEISAETDRIYIQTQRQFGLLEPTRHLQIDSPDCPDAVVWNPWQDKAARLADMPDDAWQHFVCLESGHIAQAYCLAAQHSVAFHMRIAATQR